MGLLIFIGIAMVVLAIYPSYFFVVLSETYCMS